MQESLLRAAAELSRIYEECLEVQEADDASSLGALTADDIRHRQLLDRVTQEVAALSAFIESLGRTDDADRALAAVTLLSIRKRLAGVSAAPEFAGGEPELF